MSQKSPSDLGKGVFFAVLAFATWGILPIYWKLLGSIPPPEILAHRICWSCVFLLAVLIRQRRLGLGKYFRNRRILLTLLATTLLIGSNWFIYIFAINSNRILEASMGYYITPLVNVLLGLLVLRERLTLFQWLALTLAAAGVLYMAIDYGRFPWIALALALTFSFYGLLKKKGQLPSFPSLFIETLILFPPALGLITIRQLSGQGAFLSRSPLIDLLLLGTGVITTLPLYWFAEGAKRIPLSVVGFFQYIAPTLALLIGVFLYREPFTRTHAVSFTLIWIALILYSLSLVRSLGALKSRNQRG